MTRSVPAGLPGGARGRGSRPCGGAVCPFRPRPTSPIVPDRPRPRRTPWRAARRPSPVLVDRNLIPREPPAHRRAHFDRRRLPRAAWPVVDPLDAPVLEEEVGARRDVRARLAVVRIRLAAATPKRGA